MNRTYLYVYLDPRKSGNYCYSDVCFNYEPIYVGKGCGLRYFSHIRESTTWNIPKNLKHKKINKIINDCGNLPFIVILTHGSEGGILALEEKYINEIGTVIKGTGPLCNIRTHTWSPGQTHTKNSRKSNGLSGKRFRTVTDPITNEMFQVNLEDVLKFLDLGFVASDHWERPKANNSMSRKGKLNPMYGKSTVKGRRWITVTKTEEVLLLSTSEIESLTCDFTYSRKVCRRGRKRIIIEGGEKARYMTDEEIQNLPSGTRYQFGLLWKSNREVITNGI